MQAAAGRCRDTMVTTTKLNLFWACITIIGGGIPWSHEQKHTCTSNDHPSPPCSPVNTNTTNNPTIKLTIETILIILLPTTWEKNYGPVAGSPQVTASIVNTSIIVMCCRPSKHNNQSTDDAVFSTALYLFSCGEMMYMEMRR